MDPLTITLAALKAAEVTAQAVVEVCKMYQTPQGQKLLESQMQDQAKFNAQLGNVGQWLQDLFSGKLFAALKP